MTNTNKRAKLIQLLKNPTSAMKNRLNELKKGINDLERPDFIWHFLLQSFSTMGNSRGHYGLILNRANYNRVTFEAVSSLNKEDRLNNFENVLFQAKVRMPRQKSQWLEKNYDYIVSLGGLQAVKNLALSQKGTVAKIRFMQNFHGIGSKYARNIWMDVVHPDFINNIAIDERIKKITEALGYSFDNYEKHEQFYLDIAKEAGITGWELDRLLYNFNDYFLNNL